MNAPHSVEDIVRALARYLRMNPLASDSVEGIKPWWLPDMNVTTGDLERALTWLEREGVIQATHAVDGQVRWRRTALIAEVDARLDRIINGGPS
jgi:hypothetical protein